MNIKLIASILAGAILFTLISCSYYGNTLRNVIGIDITMIKPLPSLMANGDYQTQNVFRRPKPAMVVNNSSQKKSSDSSTSSISNSKWMKKMEDKYSKINKNIKKVCKQLPSYNSSDVKDRNPNTVEKDVNKHMLVDLKHGLSYCRHGKVRKDDILSEVAVITFH